MMICFFSFRYVSISETVFANTNLLLFFSIIFFIWCSLFFAFFRDSWYLKSTSSLCGLKIAQNPASSPPSFNLGKSTELLYVKGLYFLLILNPGKDNLIGVSIWESSVKISSCIEFFAFKSICTNSKKKNVNVVNSIGRVFKIVFFWFLKFYFNRTTEKVNI